MSPKIVLSSVLVERLEKYEEAKATLYGLRSTSTITVVTFLNQADEDGYENILPAGLEKVGAFVLSIDEVNTDNQIAVIKKDGELQCFLQENDEFTNVPYEAVENLNLATLRVENTIPILLSSKEEETDGFFDKLLDKINSDTASFLMNKSSAVLVCSGDKSIIYGAPQDVTVEELACYTKQDDEETTVKSSKRSVNKNQPIKFKLFWSCVSEDTATGIPQCAPLIHHQKRVNQVYSLSLPLNTLSVIPWTDPAENIGPILCMALTRQLKLFIEDLKEQLRHSSIKNVEIPEVFHFHPDSLQHYVSLVYHPKKSEQSLENYRKQIHGWFDLLLKKPIFRRGNRHWLPEDIDAQPQLINTHIGLNLKGGNVALVQGRYAYHHYMQDNFDDNGWGCAYRSLQTIVSWFRLQGYTDRSVPTHHEIQQCLVDIGDKPASFVKSKQWIGSMEVSFCLQTLIGVDSSILNVSSGTEMSSRAPQLLEHFRTHGTPIMIGGGVLAHTIIGVDYNEETDDARFLILDPHYTGVEDLRTIQNKGWCNWKPSSFWKADSFYNMCLPMRPSCF